jgi:hypothetical protein
MERAMRDLTETERVVKKRLEMQMGASFDAGTLADALAAMQEVKPRPSPLRSELRAAISGSRVAKLAAAIAVAAFVVGIAMKVSQPVWALDQVVEAMKKYKACNLTLLDSAGVVFDVWANAEPSGEASDEIVLRGSNGALIWVKENKTYSYSPNSNAVEVDDGKTAGFTPWPGPELMKMIALAGDARTTYRKDVATGRDLVMMTGAMTTAAGPVSWFMEFDKETRLPMNMMVWNGPERSGPPSFSILRIAYRETLPEGALNVQVPEDATFTWKPIVLPDANLALLANPNQGIPVEGLTREQASRRILEQVYEAIIARDLARIRALCPLTASWSDQLLRTAILREGDEGRRPSAIVDIGGIAREGQNRIGPFVVVPVRIRTKDGRLWDEKQIVQFRQIDGRDSCVVYGPYGIVSEVK